MNNDMRGAESEIIASNVFIIRIFIDIILILEKRKKLVGVCVVIVQHYLVLEVSGTTMQRAAIKVVQLMVMRLTARLLTAAGFLDDSSLFLVPSMKERSDKKWVF